MNRKGIALVLIAAAGVTIMTLVCIVAAATLVWLRFQSPEPGPAVTSQPNPTVTSQPDSAASPQLDPSLVAPRPELGLSIREPEGLAGGPVVLVVRLRNAGAMRAARNADRLAQYEALGLDPQQEAERSGLPLPSEAEMVIQEFPLSGDWREQVTFTLARLDASSQVEPVSTEEGSLLPVFLSQSNQAATAVGVRPLLATWALPPELSEQLGAGQYIVTAQLDTAGLILERYLEGDTVISDSESFSIVEPARTADRARMEESIALYHFSQEECEPAVQHALEAIRLDPQRYFAYWYAAECQAAEGNRQEAVALLEKLLEVMPPEIGGGDFYLFVDGRLQELKR